MRKKITRRKFIASTTTAVTFTALGGQSLLGDGDKTAASDKSTPAYDLFAIEGRDCFQSTLLAVQKLGGMKQFVQRGARVGLIINSYFKLPGTYVNPEIVFAVLRMCNEAGAKEVICIPDTDQSYWQRSKKAGHYAGELAKLGPLSPKVKKIKIDGGKSLKSAEVAEDLLNVDVLINIPIIKHHNGTNFTCTLKNLMGASPYSSNKYFHHGSGAKGSYDDPVFLSQCIADLNLIVKPDLCVVDATKFITTNGPFGPGKLSKPGIVVAGKDRVAVDTYCCRFMGINTRHALMIRMAERLGLGTMDLKSLMIGTVNLAS